MAQLVSDIEHIYNVARVGRECTQIEDYNHVDKINQK